MTTPITPPAANTFLSSVEADFAAVVGWFQSAAKKVSAWIASPEGQTVAAGVAQLAGQATAYGMIEQAGANKAKISGYLGSIGSVIETVFAGSTAPTTAQVESALSSVKTDASTSALLTPFITALAQDITAYVETNDGGVAGVSGVNPWTAVAKAYVTGLVNGALVYAPATAA